MSKAKILSALPNLSPQDRSEIFEQLWRWEEAAWPTDREKNLLDESQTSHEANPSAGAPWSEVQTRLRRRKGGCDAIR